MFKVGQEEADAIAAVVRSGKLFRYNKPGGQCERFEKRYGEYLGAAHVRLTSSGTASLTAALGALEIGPGDEVIVPAHTYMATAVAVLAVGAIPVIVDIDESITLSPDAFAAAIGPRTKAVIPVHMWGLPCDMGKIMATARQKKVLVVEDACQSVGGGYEGKMLGAIGDAGAFSFNIFKNMTCGEGGAAVTTDAKLMQRITCMVDCCGFFWTGRSDDAKPFSGAGSRASEMEGAMLNVQLDRLPGMMAALRKNKKRILAETRGLKGLTAAPCNSLDYECGANIMLQLRTAEAAAAFAEKVGGGVCGKTGRHTYTEWDPILEHRAGHVPAMNPFLFAKNKGCRMGYTKEMCAKSLDILGRTVMVGNHPDKSEAQVTELIGKIKGAVG